VPVPAGVDTEAVRLAVARLQQRQESLRSRLAGRSAFVQTLAAGGTDLVVAVAGPGRSVAEVLEERRAALLNTEQRRTRSGRAHFELVQDAEGRERHLTVALDHFVCDGNASAVVAADLLRLMESGAEPDPLPRGFGELCRDRATGAEGQRDKELRNWTAAMADLEPMTGLMPHGEGELTRSQVDSVFAGGELHARVTALSEAHESTPFAVVAALTALAVRRRTGRSRFVVFTPVSTRRDEESQAAVGCFAHDRPVVCQVDPEQSLGDFLKAMMAGTWRGYRNALLSVPELAHAVPAFGRTLLDDGVDYLQLHVWMETEDADDAHLPPPADRRTVTGHGPFQPSHDLTVTTWRFGFSPRRTTLRSYFGGPEGGLSRAEEIGHEVLALLRAADGAGSTPTGRFTELVLGH